MNRSLYDVLGVDPKATPAQIKAAFRKHATAHHPDKENGDAKKMADINAAYEVLSNPERRARYDESGDNAPEKQQPQHVKLFLKVLHVVATDKGNILRLMDDEFDKAIAQGLEVVDEAQADLALIRRRIAKVEPKQGLLYESLHAQETTLSAAIEKDVATIGEFRKAKDLLRQWTSTEDDARDPQEPAMMDLTAFLFGGKKQ